MDVKWFTLNSAVTKETTVNESSHTVDHCRFQMNSQWSTAENVMTLGTTVRDSSHTVDHCRCQKNAQGSTVEDMMMLGTTLTPVAVYSKLLGVKNGCPVVYCKWFGGKGDYCE